MKTIQSFKKPLPNIKFFFVIAIVALTLGCRANNENEQDPLIIPIDQLPTNPEYSNYPMQGTTWKLSGFANLSDSTFRYARPRNDFSYKLCFVSDSTFRGTTSTNEIVGEYSYVMNTNKIEVIGIGGTKVGENYDGEFYWECLQQVQTFSISEYGLRLYFGKGSQYLLYIPFYGSTCPANWGFR